LSSNHHEHTSKYSGVGWVDIQQGTRKLHIGVGCVKTEAGKLGIGDFELLKVIGWGSFGKAMQVRKRYTNRVHALKTIQKAKTIARSEVGHTLAERSVLTQINNPLLSL
jgi:serum/glucocorticoid-regulated kinase 2